MSANKASIERKETTRRLIRIGTTVKETAGGEINLDQWKKYCSLHSDEIYHNCMDSSDLPNLVTRPAKCSENNDQLPGQMSIFDYV